VARRRSRTSRSGRGGWCSSRPIPTSALGPRACSACSETLSWAEPGCRVGLPGHGSGASRVWRVRQVVGEVRLAGPDQRWAEERAGHADAGGSLHQALPRPASRPRGHLRDRKPEGARRRPTPVREAARGGRVQGGHRPDRVQSSLAEHDGAHVNRPSWAGVGVPHHPHGPRAHWDEREIAFVLGHRVERLELARRTYEGGPPANALVIVTGARARELPGHIPLREIGPLRRRGPGRRTGPAAERRSLRSISAGDFSGRGRLRGVGHHRGVGVLWPSLWSMSR
jgi:hypothetical protein